jgi:hypothetical protein
VHYETSSELLGTLLNHDSIKTYSAGHTKHVYATGTAREAIFKLFESKSNK